MIFNLARNSFFTPIVATLVLALLVLCAVLLPRTAAAETPGCPVDVGGVDLPRASLTELREALDSGQVTSRQLTEAYLARIAALDDVGPRLHAVITTAPDALAQADAADAAIADGEGVGPLTGIPLLIKDNMDTFDMETTAGAKALLGKSPPADAHVVARLREAGAVILGKANMSEWATAISKRAGLSFSNVGGRVHNPYDGGDTSGSSNGSAVAMSATLAAGSTGSETQGSIMLPSFLNSVVGIKPTLGLVSRGGMVPAVPSFDTGGPIAKDVASAALLLNFMTGVDPRDPVTQGQTGKAKSDYTRFLRRGALRGAKIGVAPNLAPDAIARIVGKRKIIRELGRAGAKLKALRAPLFEDGPPLRPMLGEFHKSVDRYLADRGDTSAVGSLADVVAFNEAGGKDAVRFGQGFLTDALAVGKRGQRRSTRILRRFSAEVRRMIYRVMDERRLDAILVPRVVAAVSATSAGLPSVTVPAGYKRRTPFGMVLIGRRYSEPKLIAYGYDYEQRTKAWRSPARFNPDFAAVCGR